MRLVLRRLVLDPGCVRQHIPVREPSAPQPDSMRRRGFGGRTKTGGVMKVGYSLILGVALFGAVAVHATAILAAIAGQPNAGDVKTIDACRA
jgi:hypothetical protein